MALAVVVRMPPVIILFEIADHASIVVELGAIAAEVLHEDGGGQENLVVGLIEMVFFAVGARFPRFHQSQELFGLALQDRQQPVTLRFLLGVLRVVYQPGLRLKHFEPAGHGLVHKVLGYHAIFEQSHEGLLKLAEGHIGGHVIGIHLPNFAVHAVAIESIAGEYEIEGEVLIGDLLDDLGLEKLVLVEGGGIDPHVLVDDVAAVQDVLVVVFDGLVEAHDHGFEHVAVLGAPIADHHRDVQVQLFDVVDEGVVFGQQVVFLLLE